MHLDAHHQDVTEDEEPITVRSSRLGRARVLIADDDADMRDVVSETLRSSGYFTNSADSGFAFIDSIVEIEEGLRPMDGSTSSSSTTVCPACRGSTRSVRCAGPTGGCPRSS
jgi:hypothetical protein